jgi:hypothetical protein
MHEQNDSVWYYLSCWSASLSEEELEALPLQQDAFPVQELPDEDLPF